MSFSKKLFIFLLFLMFSSYISVAQKTDTLVHINGNVMTGEIKKITDGILYFKMDGMGTIPVEAEKIRTYKSRKLLQIRTKQGKILLGNIDTAEAYGYVKVGYGVNKEYISVLDIIELFPIKSTFWQRISGEFDFGLDYSKSTNMARANTSGRIDFRKPKILSSFSWNSFASAQGDDNDSIVVSEKLDMTYNYKRLIKGRWLWVANMGSNSNSELGLNLRLFMGVNIQNDIIYTNRQHLFWQIGGILNREFPLEGDVVNNPEGLFSVSYNIYKYTRPEVTLTSNVSAFPNLTFNGRWRLDTSIDLKLELFYNFYIGGKVYTNYDSKPASQNAANTDWGFAVSFGYSFH